MFLNYLLSVLIKPQTAHLGQLGFYLSKLVTSRVQKNPLLIEDTLYDCDGKLEMKEEEKNPSMIGPHYVPP